MDSRAWRIVAVLTALAAALRFSTLGVQSFWADEAITVNLLDGSLADLLRDIPGSESTPPLYYLLAFVWTKLLGTGEVAVRSLSALIGTATVPLAYAAGRRLVEERPALIGAALVAVNPILVWYSQEARAYALLVLLTVVSLGAFAAALQEGARSGTGERRALLLWALASALALGAHYFAIFVIVPEAVWLLAAARRRAGGSLRGIDRRVAGAVGGVLLVGLALVPLALRQRSHEGAEFIEDLDFGSRVLQLPKQYLLGFDGPLQVAATAAAVLLAVSAVALLLTRASADERRGARIAGVVAGIGLLVPLALASAGVDYFNTRNMLAALVPALIVLAAGFGTRTAGRAGIAAAAALCALSVAMVVAVPLDDRYQRDDWRAVAEALGPADAARAIVVSPASGATALEHYLGPSRRLGFTGFPYREVWVVGLSPRSTGESREPPRPAVWPGLAQPELEPVRRRFEDTFTLFRLRGRRETQYPGPELDELALTGGGAEVLLQRPGAPAGE